MVENQDGMFPLFFFIDARLPPTDPPRHHPVARIDEQNDKIHSQKETNHWKTKLADAIGVTKVMEQKLSPKIVTYLIIKRDPEVHLGCFLYESHVGFSYQVFL